MSIQKDPMKPFSFFTLVGKRIQEIQQHIREVWLYQPVPNSDPTGAGPNLKIHIIYCPTVSTQGSCPEMQTMTSTTTHRNKGVAVQEQQQQQQEEQEQEQ